MSKKTSALQEKINLILTITVLVLLVIVPPVLCGLLYLSRVPDVTWGDVNSPTYSRIWMYRERGPQGIGYQSQRIIEAYNATEVCVETRLRFLLWGQSRKAQPATSSRMMVLTNNRWQPNGETCR